MPPNRASLCVHCAVSVPFFLVGRSSVHGLPADVSGTSCFYQQSDPPNVGEELVMEAVDAPKQAIVGGMGRKLNELGALCMASEVSCHWRMGRFPRHVYKLRLLGYLVLSLVCEVNFECMLERCGILLWATVSVEISFCV